MICAGKSNVEIQVRRSALTASRQSKSYFVFNFMRCLLIHPIPFFYECCASTREINALFSWDASLVPGFYDKHFSDKLVFKRVERLPSLVQDVANDVDKALRAASPTLPLLCPGFITVE